MVRLRYAHDPGDLIREVLVYTSPPTDESDDDTTTDDESGGDD